MSIRRWRGIDAALSGALLLLWSGASAQTLRGPFDAAPRGAAGAQSGFVCPTPPPAVRDIDTRPFYSDANYSVVDPARYAANQASVRPISEFSHQVASMADTWLRARPHFPGPALCAVQFLDAWARADALLGVVTNQGGYERKWALAGLALAWLRLRDAPGIDPAASARIASWFQRLANAVRPHYQRMSRTDARNNHAYWAGLAVAAAGVAADDRALFEWGLGRARLGIEQIDADGALPLEMARASKALHYHLFSTMPLVMTAELGAANGIDLYAERDGALHRLIARTLDGVDDPSWFARRARHTQDFVGGRISGGNLAWIEPYFARFPDRSRAALLTRFRPLTHRWLGGNLTLAYGGR
jgi:poly(beta-D-mannuronate) lyase